MEGRTSSPQILVIGSFASGSFTPVRSWIGEPQRVGHHRGFLRIFTYDDSDPATAFELIKNLSSVEYFLVLLFQLHPRPTVTSWSPNLLRDVTLGSDGCPMASNNGVEGRRDYRCVHHPGRPKQAKARSRRTRGNQTVRGGANRLDQLCHWPYVPSEASAYPLPGCFGPTSDARRSRWPQGTQVHSISVGSGEASRG